MKILYKKHKGDYSYVNSVFEEVAQKAKELGVGEKHQVFIGIYYDDSRTTKPEEQRSIIGFAVDTVNDRILERYIP